MNKVIFVITGLLLGLDLSAQNTPLIKSELSNVNLYNGDFNYSIPLISISGPNGESFPISANYYNNGIRMDQQASWIGLGWNLNIGSITRTVNGFPDDYNGEPVSYDYNVKLNDSITVKQGDDLRTAFGPLYFKNFIHVPYFTPITGLLFNNHDLDLYQSGKNVGNLFYHIDYDDFQVSTPFISGEMQLYLHDFSNIVYKEKLSDIDYEDDPIKADFIFEDEWQNNLANWTDFLERYKTFCPTKKPQFIMKNNFYGIVRAPDILRSLHGSCDYFPTLPCDITQSWQTESMFSLGCPSNGGFSPRSILDDHNTICDEIDQPIQDARQKEHRGHRNFNNSKALSGKNIEYFTANDINNNLTQSIQRGYLDHDLPNLNGLRYEGTHSGNDLIAFTISDENGLNYHFSLPVYTYDKFEMHQPIFKSLNLVPQEIFGNNSIIKKQLTIKKPKYVSEWKLTAITGKDYEDTNENNIADDGDKGYWISFDYSLWTKNYKVKTPNVGFSNKPSKILRKNNSNKKQNENFYPSITKSEVCQEIYYINSISTSTQKMFFIKDIRLDGTGNFDVKSDIDGNESVNNYGRTPSLRLNKIVLFEKSALAENPTLFNPANNSSTYSIPASCESDFVIQNPKNWSINYYNANQILINQKALQTIEFNYDYSLCKKFLHNINVGYNYSASSNESNSDAFKAYFGFDIDLDFFDPSNIDLTGNLENSGKLTLKSISNRGHNYQKLMPDYEFKYLSGNHNPDYNPNKVDFSGLYKKSRSETNSFHLETGYVSQKDVEYLHSWSLNKIITPMGYSLNVVYEPDEYSSVGDKDYPGQNGYVERVFRMKTIGFSGGENSDINFFDPDAREFLTSPRIDKSAFEPLKLSALINNGTSYGNYVNNGTNLTYSFLDENNAIVNGNVTSAYLDNTYNNSNRYYSDYLGYMSIKLTKDVGNGLKVKRLVIEDGLDKYEATINYKKGFLGKDPGLYKSNYIDALIGIQLNDYGMDKHNGIPIVTYDEVEVNYNISNKSIGNESFEFLNRFSAYDTFEGKTACEKNVQSNGVSDLLYSTYLIEITDKSSFNGLLKSKSVFDKNNVLISKESYDYTSNENAAGIIEDLVYANYTLEGTNSGYSTLEKFGYFNTRYINPALIRKTSLSNGIEIVEDYNVRRNLFNGAVPTTKAIGPSETIETETAYEHDENPELFAKVYDVNNKNQLTLQKESFVINPKRGGSYSKYANEVSIRNFSSGYYQNNNQTFDWKIPVQNNVMQQKLDAAPNQEISEKEVSKNTLFNKDGQVLETKNFKNFSAVKFGYPENFVISQAANSNYSSFTFSGFENLVNPASGTYHFDGELIGDNTTDIRAFQWTGNQSIIPHTGKYLLKIAQGSSPISFYNKTDNKLIEGVWEKFGLEDNRMYKVVVWVHNSSPSNASLNVSVNGTIGSTNYNQSYSVNKNSAGNLTVGNWICMKLLVEIPENFQTTGNNGFKVSLTNSGSTDAYFDDLLVYPVGAAIKSMVYNHSTNLLEYEINENGFFTKFEYDLAGRPFKTYVETTEGVKLVGETKQQFKRNL